MASGAQCNADALTNGQTGPFNWTTGNENGHSPSFDGSMRQRLQKARPAAAARLGKTDISLASSRKRPVRYRYRQRFGRGWRVQADSRLDRRYAQKSSDAPSARA